MPETRYAYRVGRGVSVWSGRRCQSAETYAGTGILEFEPEHSGSTAASGREAPRVRALVLTVPVSAVMPSIDARKPCSDADRPR